MARLTRRQIESLGSMAAPPPKGGQLVSAGTSGYPVPPVKLPASAITGLGSQAAAPQLGVDPSDPLGWKAIAAALAAPKTSTPPPIDPVLAGQLGNLDQQGSDVDSGLIYNRNTGLTKLGYTAQWDPNDPFAIMPGSLTYDPNNPFSEATLLRQHFQQAKNGDTNNLAARGQLYSGALGNALATDQSNFDQNDNAILQSANGLVANAIQGHRQNLTTIGGQKIVAQGESVGRQGPSDVPSAPLPVTANSAGTPAVKPKKLVGKQVGKGAVVGKGGFGRPQVYRSPVG